MWALLAIGGLSASVVTAGTAGAATSVTVSTAKNAKAGTVLVSGKTLYTLKPSHIVVRDQLPQGVAAARCSPPV